MRKTDARPKMQPIMMLVCAMLAILLGSCACSPRAHDGKAMASDGNEASNERIALNDNAYDGPVSLEEVSVVVYNATVEGDLPSNATVEDIRTIEGLAGHGAQKLQEMGVGQVTAKNAATLGPFISYVVYRSPEYEQAAHDIAEGLDVNGSVLESGNSSATGYCYDGDIAVILCEDWALSEGLIDEPSEKARRAIDEQKTILG